MRFFLTIAAWILSAGVAFAVAPYDENADARADLQSALRTAQAQHKNVLAVFGANWCPECLRFDQAIHDGALPAAADYVIVKIDVGRFDRNLDLAKSYGNPIRKGIPAAVVLDENGAALYAGSLAKLLTPYDHLLQSIWRYRSSGAGLAGASVLAFLMMRARRGKKGS